jgi:acyl-CoA synthetase (AMP-forming)/AMP-acid ligase II
VSTLPALLLAHARERADAPALREKRRGRWVEFTWGQYAERVARAAHGLRELGVEPGDRVAVHGENRPEWVIADLAIQAIGAITVGVYPTSPAAEVEYLLGHSESVALIAEDEEQLDKALAVRERLPALRRIVVIDPRHVRAPDDAMVIGWEQLEQLGSATGIEAWERRAAGLDHDALARGIAGEQLDDRRGDLLGRDDRHAAGGDHLPDRLDDRGLGEAGADRVEPDALLRQQRPERARQAHDRVLVGGVEDVVRRAG